MGIPDVEPCYPGGQEACNAFINEHLVYPDGAKENGLQGGGRGRKRS